MATRSNGSSGPLVFISAAEQSADLHGAGLVRATRAACPTTRFVGVAGPAMVAAGCEPVFDMTRHSAMLLSAIGLAGRAASMMRRCDRLLRGRPFDAAVLIDSPTLHLPLAGRARAAGVPVLYYIAPQLWAWGASRIYKLRHRVDKLAVILPFEEAYFRDQGVDTTFVGHPLAEQFAAQPIDGHAVDMLRSRGSPVIALLPGSRRHVVEQILPGQVEVATRVAAAFPRAAFGVSIANAEVRPIIDRLTRSAGVAIDACCDRHAELIEAADLGLVASGTSTLEVAFRARPMIVMYNASRVFYHLIARWMIHTGHFALPNILAGRELVPEFMPYYTSIEPIAARAVELLRSPGQLKAMSNGLREVVGPLRAGRASQTTAAMLLALAGRQHQAGTSAPSTGPAPLKSVPLAAVGRETKMPLRSPES